MGGRGSSYYENQTQKIEELLRLLKLKKQKFEKIKDDPESERNNYELFQELKKVGISTRASTDKSSLIQLRPHQEHLLSLSNKYSKVVKTIPLETEIEFSEDTKAGAFGYLATGIKPNNKMFVRLALSDVILNDKNYYVALKKNSIKHNQSVSVDSDKIHLYTTTHEYGHLLEENIIRKRYKEKAEHLGIDYNKFSELEAARIKNEVVNNYKKMYNKNDINLSTYAKTGGDYEWFAETFTNLELSSNPAPIAKILGDYIRRS